jgi:hypothetical protein
MAVPFMTSDSGNDVCLMRDGTLCVVYILPSKDQSKMEVLDSITDL